MLTNINMNILPDFEHDLEIDDAVGLSPKVVLFNDDWHTFDEVIIQIIKATGYSIQKAESITYEVHNTGKSVVYSGDISDCLKISYILEEITLITQIEM